MRVSGNAISLTTEIEMNTVMMRGRLFRQTDEGDPGPHFTVIAVDPHQIDITEIIVYLHSKEKLDVTDYIDMEVMNIRDLGIWLENRIDW